MQSLVSQKYVLQMLHMLQIFCIFTPENIVSTTNIMQRNSHNALSHRVLPSYPCHPVCNKR